MGTGGAFFDQFIEDYFSECDEHLASARRVLLALESASAGASPPPPLHDLHRSLHTLKGLSGMVGDASAERVAHALEDALRGTERAGAGSTSDPAFLDLLFAGVDAIERCVAAHRAGEPSPDLDALLGSLARAAGTPTEEPLAPTASSVSSSDEARGVVYEFEFLPSAALVGAASAAYLALRADLAWTFSVGIALSVFSGNAQYMGLPVSPDRIVLAFAMAVLLWRSSRFSWFPLTKIFRFSPNASSSSSPMFTSATSACRLAVRCGSLE